MLPVQAIKPESKKMKYVRLHETDCHRRGNVCHFSIWNCTLCSSIGHRCGHSSHASVPPPNHCSRALHGHSLTFTPEECRSHTALIHWRATRLTAPYPLNSETSLCDLPLSPQLSHRHSRPRLSMHAWHVPPGMPPHTRPWRSPTNSNAARSTRRMPRNRLTRTAVKHSFQR